LIPMWIVEALIIVGALSRSENHGNIA
jgi:hypothetical protein